MSYNAKTPAWLAAEIIVVGTMLRHHEVIAEAEKTLSADDFGNADCRAIFEACLAISQEGTAPTAELVALRDSKIPPAIIAEAWEAGTSTAFARFAEEIAKESLRRQVRGIAIQADSVTADKAFDPIEVVDEIHAQTTRLAARSRRNTLQPIHAPDLLGQHFPEQRWAVDELLPEGLTILAGPPKLGKSWFVLSIALAVTSEADALGCYCCTKGEALYLALEDTPRRMQNRLRKMTNRNDIDPRGLYVQHEAAKIGKGLEPFLRGWLKEHPEARLVVIDTLAKIRGEKGRNASAYDFDYATVAALKSVADEHRVALVVVHHTRKMADPDPLAEVSGTMGITGAADAILVLKRERGRSESVLHVTGRDVDEQELAIAWNKDLATWTVMGNAVELRISRERNEVLDLLRNEGVPLSAKDIAEKLDKPRNTIRSRLSRMARDGMVIQDDQKRYMPNLPVDLSGFTMGKSEPAPTFEDWKAPSDEPKQADEA